jgi:hypothetical protein
MSRVRSANGRRSERHLALVAIAGLIAVISLGTVILVWFTAREVRWFYLLQAIMWGTLVLFHAQNRQRVNAGIPAFTWRTVVRSPGRYTQSDVLLILTGGVCVVAAIVLMVLAVLGLVHHRLL